MIDKSSPAGHKKLSVNKRRPKLHGPADKKAGGRPRKFAEPSQPITITLPNTTLRQLQQIDPDRGRAIVKLAQSAARDQSQSRPWVEIVEFAGNTGLVVVGWSEVLSNISFLQLVEVAPARYILVLAPGHDFNQLEIALTDLLEDAEDKVGEDRELISQLLGHFKNLRKSESMSMAQIVLVRLQPNR